MTHPLLVALAFGSMGAIFIRRALRSDRSKPLLDEHLPPATEEAVILAASHEQSPTKLTAFGQSLLPSHPSAASVLLARARILARPLPIPPPATTTVTIAAGWNLFHSIKTMAQDAAKVGPVAFIPGAGAAVVLATGLAAAGHTKGGAKIGKDIGKNKIIHGITKAYTSGYMQANPAFFAKTLALSVADKTLHGERLDRAIGDQRKVVTSWLADKAKYASQVAGVPPEATTALTAASNIAQGKPLPQDLLQAASGVVGQAIGPQASQALEQGAAYADKLSNGATSQTLAQIAQAKNVLPPETRHAFDSGLAIRTAQHLQSKGFADARKLLQDEHPAAQVLNALNAKTDDLVKHGIQLLQSQMPPNSSALANAAAAAIVGEPSLTRLSSQDLAKKLGIPEPVTRAVLASASHEIPGAPIVHAQRLKTIVGPPPAPPTLDPAHAALAMRANRGDPSAKRQLAFQATQTPASRPAINSAIASSQRAIWTGHYLAKRPAPPLAKTSPTSDAPPAATVTATPSSPLVNPYASATKPLANPTADPGY